MRLIAFFLFVFLTIDARSEKAHEPSSIVEVVQHTFGDKISKIELGKTKSDELIKLLGKPNEAEKDTFYYNINGKKYDLSIALEKDIVTSFYFDLPFDASIIHYKDIEKWITATKKKEILKEAQSQIGHNRGRNFNVDFPEYGVRMKFETTENKRLVQINCYQKKKKLK